MNRRAFLTGTASTLSLLTGCVSDSVPGSNGPTDDKPTDSPTKRTSTETNKEPSTHTESVARISTSNLVSSGLDDYPHEIRFENDLSQDRTINITVKRGSTVLYQEQHEVPAKADTVLAGFDEKQLPEEKQSVQVIYAVPNGKTETVNLDIDSCHGNVVGYFSESGNLETTHSVC